MKREDFDRESIEALLSQAHSNDRQFKHSGASSHCYRLNLPLGESAVAAFEAEHEISLPTEFRWFLTEIADGGAGPCYGILPLARILEDELDHEPSDVIVDDPTKLPGRTAWVSKELQDIVIELSPIIGEFVGEQPPTSLKAPFVPPLDASDGRPYPADGILPLAHVGCGGMYVLVVAGPERGNMWELTSSGYYQPIPDDNLRLRLGRVRSDRILAADGEYAATVRAEQDYVSSLLSDQNRSRMTFWEWYSNWLSEVSAR